MYTKLFKISEVWGTPSQCCWRLWPCCLSEVNNSLSQSASTACFVLFKKCFLQAAVLLQLTAVHMLTIRTPVLQQRDTGAWGVLSIFAAAQLPSLPAAWRAGGKGLMHLLFHASASGKCPQSNPLAIFSSCKASYVFTVQDSTNVLLQVWSKKNYHYTNCLLNPTSIFHKYISKAACCQWLDDCNYWILLKKNVLL